MCNTAVAPTACVVLHVTFLRREECMQVRSGVLGKGLRSARFQLHSSINRQDQVSA